MWSVERDPVMRSTFLNVTFLDAVPDFERFRRRMKIAVTRIERLHQRVESPGLGRAAAWVDDPDFDIDYHVRRVALPGPGTTRQLLDDAAVLYQDAFDPARPLWQLTIVEGLENDRAALLAKMHHTITDGQGGIRISEQFIDLERDATELATDKPDSALAGSLNSNGQVSGRDLVTAAEGGDSDALLLMENFARMLGIGIANYVNIFEPSRFAIGGGLSRASHLFLDRAVKEAGARALPALWKRVSVALAEGGADAGVIGAGLLAALELAHGRDTELPKATTTEGIE